MADPSISELATIFNRVPRLARFRPQDFHIKSLPGFTNLNIQLKNDQLDWVLRVPKPVTNQTINRRHEAINASIAYRLGIAPECIWRDESGLSLTMTLAKSRSMIVQDLNNDSLFNSLIDTINRLHQSKSKFQGRVDLGELIKRYYRLAPRKCQKPIEPGYRMALKQAELLSRQKTPLVPSHNDLVLENILVDETAQIWFIDWEYASMATPYWDLATLCNGADFDSTRSKQLLDYYQIKSAGLEFELLTEYRFLLKVLSICWMSAFTEIDVECEIESLKN